MTKTSAMVARIGLGITFLWIGVLVFSKPAEWGSYIQPWALQLLPVPLEEAMRATALLDAAVGVWLIVGHAAWLAALIAALHLSIVLITSGITDITVRDIGLHV